MSVLEGKVAAGGGRIVSVLSNLRNNPVVPHHDYATAKSVLLGFSRNLAAELGPYDTTGSMVIGGIIEETAAPRRPRRFAGSSPPRPRPDASARRKNSPAPSSCSPSRGPTS